jgi:hypothetical protein
MNRFPYQKFAILCLCKDGEWHRGTEFLELSTTDRPKRTARELAQVGHLFVKYEGMRKETIYRITDSGLRLLSRLSSDAMALGISAPAHIKKNGRRLHRDPIKRAREAATNLRNQTLFEEWEALHE